MTTTPRACSSTGSGPTLSLLIATYNRADLLDETLRSVLEGATELPDQIVVVHGGSDHTPVVVARHAARHPRLIDLVEIVNRGLSHAQNVGWPSCRGEIVATLDDDVEVAPDWVACIRASHRAHPNAGGIGGKICNRNTASVAARFEQARVFDIEGSGVVKVRTVAGVNMSYKRAVMALVGPFDEKLPSGMDVDYNWRVALAGYDILYDPSIVLTHHNRTDVWVLLRQQHWYGRGYFGTRRKWPALPSGPPRHLWGWKNWVKMGFFVVDPFYQALRLSRRADRGDRLAFAVLAVVADMYWKIGFVQAWRETAWRPSRTSKPTWTERGAETQGKATQ